MSLAYVRAVWVRRVLSEAVALALALAVLVVAGSVGLTWDRGWTCAVCVCARALEVVLVDLADLAVPVVRVVMRALV